MFKATSWSSTFLEFSWLIFKWFNLYIRAKGCLHTLLAAYSAKKTRPGGPRAHIPDCFSGFFVSLDISERGPGHRSGQIGWCPKESHPLSPQYLLLSLTGRREWEQFLVLVGSFPPPVPGGIGYDSSTTSGLLRGSGLSHPLSCLGQGSLSLRLAQ